MEFLGGPERVAVAVDHENRDLDVGEMIDPQFFGPAGWVKGIAKANQTGTCERSGQSHAAHTSAHRTSAVDESVKAHAEFVGESLSLLNYAADEFRGSIRWSASRCASVREIDAAHRQIEASFQSEVDAMVPVASGTVGQKESSRLRHAVIRVVIRSLECDEPP